MNLKFKSFIALVAASLMLILANLSGAGSFEPLFQAETACSTCCSMPCCQKAIEKTSCCCSVLPQPSNNNLPIGNNKDEGIHSQGVLAQSTLPAPAFIFNEKTNMVGRTTGLEKPVPPSVKLYILNESILC